ncbi:unnamed protein product, partial [Amoebophrya sp. A25]
DIRIAVTAGERGNHEASTPGGGGMHEGDQVGGSGMNLLLYQHTTDVNNTSTVTPALSAASGYSGPL